MSALNRNRISLVLSVIALLAAFAFLAHHVIGLSGTYAFCLFVACAFIPAFFSLPIVLHRSFTRVQYCPSRGSEITLLLEKPPRY